jgi:hypothetical protein
LEKDHKVGQGSLTPMIFEKPRQPSHEAANVIRCHGPMMNQEDPGMRPQRLSPFAGERDEVDNVVRHEDPILLYGYLELLSVVQSSGPRLLRFLRAQGVVARPAQLSRDFISDHLV